MHHVVPKLTSCLDRNESRFVLNEPSVGQYIIRNKRVISFDIRKVDLHPATFSLIDECSTHGGHVLPIENDFVVFSGKNGICPGRLVVGEPFNRQDRLTRGTCLTGKRRTVRSLTRPWKVRRVIAPTQCRSPPRGQLGMTRVKRGGFQPDSPSSSRWSPCFRDQPCLTCSAVAVP